MLPRMNAMVLHGPAARGPWLREETRPDPEPGPTEVLVRVRACGVCHTDLHEALGEVPLPVLPIVPGHEVVGEVVATGARASGVRIGERVGIAWLASACGVCAACRSGRENLCRAARFTGYHRDGGYAELVMAEAAFVHPIPAAFDDATAAPLLCAGVIGYRALELSGVRPGERLGLYGFGASAHLVAQVARHRGCELFVVTRGEEHRQLARALGAAWVGAAEDEPPAPLDAAILFAPSGRLVPPALAALADGGTLAIACLALTPIPGLDYDRHLFRERVLRSVTASTRDDARRLLAEAAAIPLRPEIVRLPLARANEALERLAGDGVRGAAVLEVG